MIYENQHDSTNNKWIVKKITLQNQMLYRKIVSDVFAHKLFNIISKGFSFHNIAYKVSV